jgi:hypothetical protein
VCTHRPLYLYCYKQAWRACAPGQPRPIGRLHTGTQVCMRQLVVGLGCRAHLPVTRAYTSYGDGRLFWELREFVRARFGIAGVIRGAAAGGGGGMACSILFNMRNASHSSRGVLNFQDVIDYAREHNRPCSVSVLNPFGLNFAQRMELVMSHSIFVASTGAGSIGYIPFLPRGAVAIDVGQPTTRQLGKPPFHGADHVARTISHVRVLYHEPHSEEAVFAGSLDEARPLLSQVRMTLNVTRLQKTVLIARSLLGTFDNVSPESNTVAWARACIGRADFDTYSPFACYLLSYGSTMAVT